MNRLITLLILFATGLLSRAEDKVYYGYCPQTLEEEYLAAMGTGENGLIQVAVCLDPATDPAVARLNGQRILGLRVHTRTDYTASQRSTDRYVFHAQGEITAESMMKTTCKFREGWNEVLFKEPVAIGDGPLYLGASVYETMGSPFPFGVYNKAQATNGYLCNVHKEGWQNRSGSVLLIEAILEGTDPTLAAADGPLSATAHVSFKCKDLAVRPSSLMDGELYIHNQSAQSLGAVSFESKDAAGETHLHSLDLSDSPLAPFDGRVISYRVMSPSMNGTAQPLTLSVSSVTTTDAQQLDARDRGVSFTATQLVMEDAFQRIPLVEEFTSQYCINCPFMIYYLDKALKQWREEGKPVLYVTHHSGFQNDMFTQSVDGELTYLFGKDASYNPAVMYDRRMFSGNNAPVMSAKTAEVEPYTEAITAVSQIPALAEVLVNLSDDRTEVTVSGAVNRDVVAEGSPIYLTCYLIEDGIPTDPFFQKGLTDFSDAPEDLAETFRHNGVVRHVFTKEATGDLLDITNTGKECTFSVTYPLPEKVNPLPVIDQQKCDIVAFLHFVDKDYMPDNFLLNAGSLRYTNGTVGITHPNAAPATAPAYYDLQGRRTTMQGSKHGIYIDGNGKKFIR